MSEINVKLNVYLSENMLKANSEVSIQNINGGGYFLRLLPF